MNNPDLTQRLAVSALICRLGVIVPRMQQHDAQAIAPLMSAVKAAFGLAEDRFEEAMEAIRQVLEPAPVAITPAGLAAMAEYEQADKSEAAR